MPKTNIDSPEFHYRKNVPDGFQRGMARLGPGLGASRTGTTVYELPPGQAICPYHYEYGEEEWLLVMEGRPTLRTPEGSEQLEPRDLAFFPRGPEGAHGVRNETEETVRVLMFSEVVYPTISVYPDSDKLGAYAGNDDDTLTVKRSSGVDYFEGER
jgi:uncharacterized cupin superfamily protein